MFCMHLAKLIRGLEPFSGKDPLVDKETAETHDNYFIKRFKKNWLTL